MTQLECYVLLLDNECLIFYVEWEAFRNEITITIKNAKL